MSTELMAKLFQLNRLKKFNETLTQRKQSMEELTKSLMDFDLRRDSVVDDIRVCRSDVPFIERKRKSKKFKCLQNNCQFKCRLRIQLKRHRLSHKYEKRFKCNECQKGFRFLNGLKIHQMFHSNEKKICLRLEWMW